MAGRGPAPKPAHRRAGHSKDRMPTRALQLVRVPAPELPEDVEWHPRTREWWRLWAGSELARDFTGTDWSFLIDTAVLHHAMWSAGQWKLAGEVRIRVAKFGATPEDRARLRITFADADERDDKRASRKAASSRARRGALKVTDPDGAEPVQFGEVGADGQVRKVQPRRDARGGIVGWDGTS